jgi:hypothetical protein
MTETASALEISALNFCIALKIAALQFKVAMPATAWEPVMRSSFQRKLHATHRKKKAQKPKG